MLALSCLSSQIVLNFVFDYILILWRSFCKANCITCAKHDTRSKSCTFVFTSSNSRLVRNNCTNSICKIKLLAALSFVITFNWSSNFVLQLCLASLSSIFVRYESLLYVQKSAESRDRFIECRWNTHLSSNNSDDWKRISNLMRKRSSFRHQIMHVITDFVSLHIEAWDVILWWRKTKI